MVPSFRRLPRGRSAQSAEALEFREGGGELVVVFGEQYVRHRVTSDRTARYDRGPSGIPAYRSCLRVPAEYAARAAMAVRAASPAPAVEPLGPRGASPRGAEVKCSPTPPQPARSTALRNLVDHANTHEKHMRRSISNSPYLLTDFTEHYGRLLFYPEHYGRLLISLCENFGFLRNIPRPRARYAPYAGIDDPVDSSPGEE